MTTRYWYKDQRYTFTTNDLSDEVVRLVILEGYQEGPVVDLPTGLDRKKYIFQGSGNEKDYGTIIDAIRMNRHAPHIWGGGYDPTIDSIDSTPIFEYKHKTISPIAWAVATNYTEGFIVSHADEQWEAIEVHISTQINSPSIESSSWRKLFVYDSTKEVLPMDVSNSALFINSEFLYGEKSG